MELLLKNFSKHISLTPGEWELIKTTFQPKKLKRKAFLLQEGEICRYENFVLKGCLRVYRIDENGFSVLE